MKTKAELAEYMRSWRTKNIDACRKKERARRKANREKVRRWAREHYKRNRDRIALKALEYRRKNRWKVLCQSKAAAANRRYPGKITGAQVEEIFAAANRACRWCGATGLTGRNLTLEHVEPINDVKCLGVSCSSCNIARIPARGPRKSREQKALDERERQRKWRAENKGKYNERWWRMDARRRQERRDYMREYMKKRRANKKQRERD